MKKPSTITSDQIRAARQLLGLSQADVATKLGISSGMVGYVEVDRRHTDVSRARVIRCLEEMGIEFLEDRGVTLRR